MASPRERTPVGVMIVPVNVAAAHADERRRLARSAKHRAVSVAGVTPAPSPWRSPAARDPRTRSIVALALAAFLAASVRPVGAVVPATSHAILFVTQVPVGGFGSSTPVLGDPTSNPETAPRGG